MEEESYLRNKIKNAVLEAIVYFVFKWLQTQYRNARQNENETPGPK